MHAATLQDFETRVDRYLSVRRKAGSGLLPLKPTNDPAQIKAEENALAAAIREARADAKPGDILTPEVQDEIRRLIAPQLKGKKGEHAKAVLGDDAPAEVPYKVNAKYPEGTSLPSVPSKLLLNLPMLPRELEYRIVGRTLILRDTDADLIVDFMANAIA